MGDGTWGMEDGVAEPLASVQNFRDLRVWQAAMVLAESVYEVTRCLPREELFGLSAQLRRAVVSVPSNIAEGHSRTGTGEHLHHLSIALGSLAEVQTQLELVQRLEFASPECVEPCLVGAVRLARQIHALRNALRDR